MGGGLASLLESPWICFCRQVFSCGEAERLFIESSYFGNLSPLSSLGASTSSSGRGGFKLYLGYLLDRTYQRRRLSVSSIESSLLPSASHLTPPPHLCHGACLHTRGLVHLHEGVAVRALQGAIYYVLFCSCCHFCRLYKATLLTYYISRFRAFWNFTSASGLVRDLPSFW